MNRPQSDPQGGTLWKIFTTLAWMYTRNLLLTASKPSPERFPDNMDYKWPFLMLLLYFAFGIPMISLASGYVGALININTQDN